MNIFCSITLAAGDDAVDPAKAAERFLEAIGGDPDRDTCTVTVMPTPESATRGVTALSAESVMPPTNGNP